MCHNPDPSSTPFHRPKTFHRLLACTSTLRVCTCQETVDGLWPMEGGTRRVRIMAHDWSLSLALHQLQACSAFHNLLLAISRIMAHVTLSARCSSNPIYPAQCAGVLWC